MKVIAITSFVHGALHLHAGDKAEFSSSTAAELVRHGLVAETAESETAQLPAAQVARATRAARVPSNKKAPELDDKSDDAQALLVSAAALPAVSLPELTTPLPVLNADHAADNA